jgi:hypothetical protein
MQASEDERAPQMIITTDAVPALLDRREAAEVLCISTATLDRLAKAGLLVPVRFPPSGRTVRYDPRDLLRFIESGKAFALPRAVDPR